MFKVHPIQPFKMTDLPFNGKYVFHLHGAQCPWLRYSLQKDALCLYSGVSR